MSYQRSYIILLEVKIKLAAKLGVSLLGFLQKTTFGSLSASLNQWSPNHWFAIKDGQIFSLSDLSFESVDKLYIVRTS